MLLDPLILPLGFGIPLTVIGVTLALGRTQGMKTELKKALLAEAGRRKELLAASASLRSDTEDGPQALGNGQIANAVIGTFPARILPIFIHITI